jgi:hypothetical protein
MSSIIDYEFLEKVTVARLFNVETDFKCLCKIFEERKRIAKMISDRPGDLDPSLEKMFNYHNDVIRKALGL